MDPLSDVLSLLKPRSYKVVLIWVETSLSNSQSMKVSNAMP